jgi:hypothetical protein
MPPSSWLPDHDWLPDPSWPAPPDGWSWWTVVAPQPGTAPDPRGRLAARPSFPVATRAAQSTVSLAALFPDRAREEVPYGTGSPGYAAGSPSTPEVRTKAGREYYVPASERVTSVEAAVLPGATLTGSRVDGTASGDGATAAPPGIRLSPLLRLVGDPTGVRARFTVGGPAARDLSDVLAPAIEAAVGRSGHSSEASSGVRSFSGAGGGGVTGAPSRRGFFWRRFGRAQSSGAAGGGEEMVARDAASDKTRASGETPAHHTGGAGPSRAAAGRREARAAGTPVAGVDIGSLTKRALEARRLRDPAAAAAVERDLLALHRRSFPSIRRPALPPAMPLDREEEATVRRHCLEAALGGVERPSKGELAAARSVADARVDAVLTASRVARDVRAQHCQALADAAWQLLSAHDPATVVAVVDEALALSRSDLTCLDAGTDATTGRAYVTVLLRFAPMVVIADEALEGSNGRRSHRPRTPRERHLAYAAGLASAVLAATKQVDSVAPGTDDVCVVVVRPTPNHAGVEPIYVGTLDREDVTLRHPEADPVPLLVGSAAPDGIRLRGPDREVMALDPARDIDRSLHEIVAACRDAMAPTRQ